MLRFDKMFLILLLFFVPLFIAAQENKVLVKGKVVQDVPVGFADLLVVNMNKGRGVYGSLDGTFEIEIEKNDLIKISCRGFHTASISLKDSVLKKEYFVIVPIQTLQFIQENPVVIRPAPRISDLKKTQDAIGTYQYKPLVNGFFDMLFHPITAIYQAFSKKEAEKRKYADLMNQKQLDDYVVGVTRYLMFSGLIELEEDEVLRFAARCPISEDFAQQASLYEVSQVVKACYQNYARIYKVEKY